jgi:hypothetical protein
MRVRDLPSRLRTSLQRGDDMRLEIGNRARCSGGIYSELWDIVVDPIQKHLTQTRIALDGC